MLREDFDGQGALQFGEMKSSSEFAGRYCDLMNLSHFSSGPHVQMDPLYATRSSLILSSQGSAMSDEDECFRTMVEVSQDWFWEFDENANFTCLSPRIRGLLGYESEELIGLNAFDLMDADEAEGVHGRMQPSKCLQAAKPDC